MIGFDTSNFVRKDARKVFLPYPANVLAGIILVAREPQLAFLGDDIEHLLKS